jgi:hypothetical protein
VRPKHHDPQVLVVLTTENGRITLGGEAGTISVLIEDDVTKSWELSSAVYDLELYKVEDGKRRTVRFSKGSVSLDFEVTLDPEPEE